LRPSESAKVIGSKLGLIQPVSGAAIVLETDAWNKCHRELEGVPPSLFIADPVATIIRISALTSITYVPTPKAYGTTTTQTWTTVPRATLTAKKALHR
jgi:hypothetical protein